MCTASAAGDVVCVAEFAAPPARARAAAPWIYPGCACVCVSASVCHTHAVGVIEDTRAGTREWSVCVFVSVYPCAATGNC